MPKTIMIPPNTKQAEMSKTINPIWKNYTQVFASNSAQ